MSRPQKMHKPLKGDFSQIINAIADGKGVAKTQTRTKNIVKATDRTLSPKKSQ
jgi:hypothetical protein